MFENSGRMSRKGKVIIAVASVLIGVLLVAGFLFAGPAYDSFKRFRARQLVADIGAYYESGDWLGFEIKLLSAARLAPKDEKVMLAQARYLSARQHPAVMDFWMQVVREHPRVPEVWEAFFLSAIQFREHKLAALALEGFRRSNPDNINRVREHEVQLLAVLGRTMEAIQTARVHMKEADPSEAFLIAANTLFLTGNDTDQREAMQWFWSRSEQLGGTALAALVTLARRPDLNEVEVSKIVARLRDHPMAQLEHGYLAAALESRLFQKNEADGTQVWKDFISNKPLPARVQIARWLMDAGNFDLAGLAVGAENARVQRDAALVYLELLGQRGDWEALAAVVEDKETPMHEFMRHLFLARCHWETGDSARFELAWRRAVAAAQREVSALIFLANYAEIQRWDTEAQSICKLLIETTDGQMSGWLGLYNLAVKRQDTALREQAATALDRLMLQQGRQHSQAGAIAVPEL
jgi:hypothetical protein